MLFSRAYSSSVSIGISLVAVLTAFTAWLYLTWWIYSKQIYSSGYRLCCTENSVQNNTSVQTFVPKCHQIGSFSAQLYTRRLWIKNKVLSDLEKNKPEYSIVLTYSPESMIWVTDYMNLLQFYPLQDPRPRRCYYRIERGNHDIIWILFMVRGSFLGPGQFTVSALSQWRMGWILCSAWLPP